MIGGAHTVTKMTIIAAFNVPQRPCRRNTPLPYAYGQRFEAPAALCTPPPGRRKLSSRRTAK